MVPLSMPSLDGIKSGMTSGMTGLSSGMTGLLDKMQSPGKEKLEEDDVDLMPTRNEDMEKVPTLLSP